MKIKSVRAVRLNLPPAPSPSTPPRRPSWAEHAEGAGLTTILHGGGNTPFGQHFTFAQPSMTWMEVFVGAPPGVPLSEGGRLPGQALPRDGYLVPVAAPGFGMELKAEWISPFFT